MSLEDWKAQVKYQYDGVDMQSRRLNAPSEHVLNLFRKLTLQSCTDGMLKDSTEVVEESEKITWLDFDNSPPIWSRLNQRNFEGLPRYDPRAQYRCFNIEMQDCIWSMWGKLHPEAGIFKRYKRGKQQLACNVVACLAASMYPFVLWAPKLMDTIVRAGDGYYEKSRQKSDRKDLPLSIEELLIDCELHSIVFLVNIEMVAYGKLYEKPAIGKRNLADALVYFFKYFQFGILQCQMRSLAFGRSPLANGGYFMYDCQCKDSPIFNMGERGTYLLVTPYMQVLLYCIVATLNVRNQNVHFTLHNVDILKKFKVENTDNDDDDDDDKTERNQKFQIFDHKSTKKDKIEHANKNKKKH